MNRNYIHHGKVIWITGFPGAGKTTTSELLCTHLRSLNYPTVALDGDKLREVFGVSGGYSVEERKQLSYQYSRLAKLISEQGQIVVVSTVSLFHEIHDWNRKNITDYIEVFLDVDMKTLKSRDQKMLYSNAENGLAKNVVGTHIAAEIPLNPDITITNDGNLSAISIANTIIGYCEL